MCQGRAANPCPLLPGTIYSFLQKLQFNAVYFSEMATAAQNLKSSQEFLRIMKMRSVGCAGDWERDTEFSVILSGQKSKNKKYYQGKGDK